MFGVTAEWSIRLVGLLHFERIPAELSLILSYVANRQQKYFQANAGNPHEFSLLESTVV